jgi:diphosphomevalonate decarboxylase
MNLSAAVTTTTVEFLESLHTDIVEFEGETVSEKEIRRVTDFLNLVRQYAKKQIFAHVRTKNSFPKGTGIASSASGFAALTIAATASIGLSLSQKDHSILARID